MYNVEMQVSYNKNLPLRRPYYGGMIDLNILNKCQDYSELKKSYNIFICKEDPYGLGLHKYTFERRCVEDFTVCFGDNTTIIVLNTSSEMENDVSPELKSMLDYFDGREPSDDFSKN